MGLTPWCGIMDRMQDAEEIATAVGRNVRGLRQQRRMTIDGLAAASGLSRGTVIQVESARGNPSIATLCNLAAALQVGVSSLVSAQAAPRVTVRSGADAAALWTSAAGSRALFRIGTDPPDMVELWDWTLQTGDSFAGEAHPRGTSEVLFVLEGQLALQVGDERRVLGVHDTVVFEAHARHRYANESTTPVRFIMVVLIFGDSGLVPPFAISPAEPEL
jgi:transcriptional regulator with XRE-family HTH domain